MRAINLHHGNVHFAFVLMFLVTFIIFLITEVSFSTYYKSHAQNQNQFLTDSELYDVGKTEDSVSPDTPKDAVWQNVNGSRHKFFVYSAFLDSRSRRQWVIRIIAATKTKNPDKVACMFHYTNGKERIPAKITTISENWSLPYSAVFIICNLKNFTSVPQSISVSVYNRSQALYIPTSNHILVNNRNLTDLTLGENKDKIAICVKPLHFNFDKTIQLIEFLELNRLLGVSHFTFYNASTGPSARCVLEEYMKAGLVSVYSWKLEINSKTEIRTEGMFASLNDCLYRNMYVYPYVAFIDIDEFIVPRFNITLMDLIRWLSIRYNTSNISSYSFQNAFFYIQWANDANLKFENEVEKKLITIQKTRRRVKLNAHKQRSKYIAKPKNVVEVGNHFVWQSFPNQNTLNVPADIAILNHYRVCEFGGDDCVHLLSTVDRTLYRYRKVLTCNVAQRWLPLIQKCNLPMINSLTINDVCNIS